MLRSTLRKKERIPPRGTLRQQGCKTPALSAGRTPHNLSFRSRSHAPSAAAPAAKPLPRSRIPLVSGLRLVVSATRQHSFGRCKIRADRVWRERDGIVQAVAGARIHGRNYLNSWVKNECPPIDRASPSTGPRSTASSPPPETQTTATRRHEARHSVRAILTLWWSRGAVASPIWASSARHNRHLHWKP